MSVASKVNLQRNLSNPRVPRPGDDAEAVNQRIHPGRGRVQRESHGVERRMVEGVEELATELQPPVFRHLKVLEQRQVPLIHPGITQAVSTHIAKGSGLRAAEG